MPAEGQLSGTIFVIIIAVSVQACIIFAIFVKRQIERFALRNRRGPHMSIGHGGPKSLRRDADRRLDYVPYIRYEPQLAPPPKESLDFRRKIIFNFQSFEYHLATYSQHYIRPPGANIRSHLFTCTYGPLMNADARLIHLVCDDYNNARHHYQEVTEGTFNAFFDRITQLRDLVRANKSVKPHPSPVPPLAASSSSTSLRRKRQRKRSGGGGKLKLHQKNLGQ